MAAGAWLKPLADARRPAPRHAERMTRFALHRYGSGARLYDMLSLERPVYRVGRARGVDLLGLRHGDRVLDVGSGTGLSLPSLRRAVGERGKLVGVDASAQMLAIARRRIAAQGWTNVDLRCGDAAHLETLLRSGESFDAVLFAYALSVITDWERAWDGAVAALRPGGRVLIVDLALPIGWGRLLSPLARFACFVGGSDPRREPWRRLFECAPDAVHAIARCGHIHLAVGTPVQAPKAAA